MRKKTSQELTVIFNIPQLLIVYQSLQNATETQPTQEMSDSKFIAQKNGDLYEYAAMIIKKMYIHEKWALKYTT